MSCITYFASNEKLENRENPYVLLLSMNEARERNIELKEDFIEGIDPNEKDVICYVTDERKLGYPNIYSFDKEMYNEDIGTKQKYCVCLEIGEMTKEYLQVVYNYIVDQWKGKDSTSFVLELWNVWLGDGDIPTKVKMTTCHLKELTLEKIEGFLNSEDVCVRIVN